MTWQCRGALRCSRWKRHFSPKNAFFGQKMTFLWKIHFIQNSSVTKNTSYTYSRKKIFLLKLWFSNFHRIQPNHGYGVWQRTITVNFKLTIELQLQSLFKMFHRYLFVCLFCIFSMQPFHGTALDAKTSIVL